jgi:AcrR family transcriptional regulator
VAAASPALASADAAAPAAPRKRASRSTGVREASAQATREGILRAATKVFAAQGYAGGRIKQISRAARSHDRMIYYYFGSKEALFVAVLEELYRRYNEAEARLVLDVDAPLQSLHAVVRFMWNYFLKHPEFITLLNSENLHRGRHIAKSARASGYSVLAVDVLARVLDSGVRQKIFRADAAARDVYLIVSALGYFYLSNRYTLSAFLGEALDAPAALAHWEEVVIDTVTRAVKR